MKQAVPLPPQSSGRHAGSAGVSVAPRARDEWQPALWLSGLTVARQAKLIGVLEIAEELPALDRFQAAMQEQIATTAIASLCSLLAVAVYLGNRLSQSLHHIRRQTRAIVNGDFDHRLSIQIP